MKLLELLQFICAILLTMAAFWMMFGAFINDSMIPWKLFTIALFAFGVWFIKQSWNELSE